MTPDKINAMAVIKQLLDRCTQRQSHLEEVWKQRKTALEQNMQVWTGTHSYRHRSL